MSERIIVTGANGFLGSNIVGACLNAGCAVAAVDLRFDNPAYAGLAGESLRLIEADCADMPAVSADALIHAAAVTATPAERGESPEANLRANIEPFLSVMEYTERQRIRRAIFVSSAAVHRGTTESFISESLPPRPHGEYSVAKTFMEHTVETMRSEHGRDWLCIRPGSIYGPHEFVRSTRPKLSAVALMMRSTLTQGEIVVDQPDARNEWTFAPDIGRALIEIIKADSLNYPLYQVSSGEQQSNLEIARKIARLLPGVSLRVAPTDVESGPQSSQPRVMDTARLKRDVGFNHWTKMSAATLQATLEGIAKDGAGA